MAMDANGLPILGAVNPLAAPLQQATETLEVALDLLIRVAVTDPWKSSYEGLNDCCMFCETIDRRTSKRADAEWGWLYEITHAHDCTFIAIRMLLRLPREQVYEDDPTAVTRHLRGAP